jgi:hypothetical protein
VIGQNAHVAHADIGQMDGVGRLGRGNGLRPCRNGQNQQEKNGTRILFHMNSLSIIVLIEFYKMFSPKSTEFYSVLINISYFIIHQDSIPDLRISIPMIRFSFFDL